MTCDHVWVMYQPFQGEPYECCANAGCGIRRDEYEKSTQTSFMDKATETGDGTIIYDGVDWHYYSRQNSTLPAGRDIKITSIDTDAPWSDGFTFRGTDRAKNFKEFIDQLQGYDHLTGGKKDDK